MGEAANQWVDMNELERTVGKVLSRTLGCEDGIVTSGAYAASSIAAHTSLAMAKERSADLSSPNIVIQSSHLTKYAEAYVTGGITLKEIRRKSESDSLSKYVDSSTVAIAYVISASDYEFSLKETVEASRRLGIPTIVDASIVDPAVRGVKEVLKYDPDLVSVSGGKGFNGPNSSGLLLGKSISIAKARSLAFPNYGPGRGMKVSKEQIVGLMVAIELAREAGDTVVEEWQKKIRELRSSLGSIHGVRTEVLFPWRLNFPQPIPRLMIYIERKDGEEKAELVRNELANGTPPIWTRPLWDLVKAKNAIAIEARTIQSKDIRVVAESLRIALHRVLARPTVATA